MDVGELWRQIAAWLEQTPHKQEVRLLIEFIFFSILLWQLKRERRKLDAAVATIGQRLSAIQETVEQAPAPPPPNATVENWERMRMTWADARERLERLIVENISDGRKRRKYGNLPRYSYEAVIDNLRKDKYLSPEAAAKLIAMNARFLALRRARAATRNVADEFLARFAEVESELPELPLDNGT